MPILPSSPREAVVRLLNSDPLRSLFFQATTFQHRRQGAGCPFGTYYEFGVGVGHSLRSYLRAIQSFATTERVPASRFSVVVFDTFQGLPMTTDPRDQHPGWHPGRFAASRERIERILSGSWLLRHGGRSRLVEGRFEESLTSSLRQELDGWRPAIINVDCDYYTSAHVALEWVRPLLAPGAIVHFDDFWEQMGDPNRGEAAAVEEFNEAGPGRLTPFPNVGLSSSGAVFMFTERRPHP